MSISAQILMLNIILCGVGLAGFVLHRRRFLRSLFSLQTIFIASSVTIGIDGKASALFLICLNMVYVASGLAVFMLYLKKHTEEVSEAEGKDLL